MKNKRHGLSILTLSLFALSALLVSACGGGGSSPQQGEDLVGIFVDAPVQGLSYSQADGPSGTTDENGAFTYRSDGGQVTFSLGNVTIGTIGGAARVTPYDIAGDNQDMAINIAQFIQSMHPGWDGQTAINVSAAGAHLADVALDFSAGASDFEAALDTVIAQLPDGDGYQKVDRAAAQTALEEGTKNTFEEADFANSVFLVQRANGESLSDYAVLTFYEVNGDTEAGLDFFTDFVSNGGDGYGEVLNWWVDSADGILRLGMDEVERVATVVVDGATRYTVEVTPHEGGASEVFYLTKAVPFEAGHFNNRLCTVSLHGGAPVEVPFSADGTGYTPDGDFTWTISDLGGLEMDFGPSEINDGGSERWRMEIWVARLDDSDFNFSGIFIDGDMDSQRELANSFEDGGFIEFQGCSGMI